MKTIYILCIYMVVVLMTGCGASDDSDKNATQDAPPPVSHTVFAPYIREIDKAKNVQNTTDAQKQALDRQIQAQTGTSNAPSATSQSPP
ncbi:MAG TPA: hypothetical protein VNI53_05835 [Gammaproteobacteria bacterium]|nr:hypothetical protein [Gammaproteobacteria bacterium]